MALLLLLLLALVQELTLLLVRTLSRAYAFHSPASSPPSSNAPACTSSTSASQGTQRERTPLSLAGATRGGAPRKRPSVSA